MLPMAVTSPHGERRYYMVQLESLKSLVDYSGMTMTAIAQRLGMSRATLYKKLDGKTEFKVSEIVSLCKVLHLSDKERDLIFFS